MKGKLLGRPFELAILVLSIFFAIVLEHLFSSFFGGHFNFVQIGFAFVLMVPPVIMAALAYSWLVDRTLKTEVARLGLRIPANVIGRTETQAIERNSKEIWVITTDFFWDTKNEYSKDIVMKNIKAGKKYRYFCPDTDSSKKCIAEICKNFAETHGVEMVLVPADRINALFFEYVIYDVDTKKSQGILVDVFGKRYSRPTETVDMLLDSQDVLPKLIDLAVTWSSLGVKSCPGTHVS